MQDPRKEGRPYDPINIWWSRVHIGPILIAVGSGSMEVSERGREGGRGGGGVLVCLYPVVVFRVTSAILATKGPTLDALEVSKVSCPLIANYVPFVNLSASSSEGEKKTSNIYYFLTVSLALRDV